MFSFQVNFFVWILVDKLEFVWLKWKLQKYIDLYLTYTLILSSQGGVSDVIKWNY